MYLDKTVIDTIVANFPYDNCLHARKALAEYLGKLDLVFKKDDLTQSILVENK